MSKSFGKLLSASLKEVFAQHGFTMASALDGWVRKAEYWKVWDV